MDGIAHIASPFHLNVRIKKRKKTLNLHLIFHLNSSNITSPLKFPQVTDPHKDLIDPAVNGTESILKSANGPNGKSIKRIVITSSFAAVNFPTEDLDYVFSEKDWNQYSAQVVQEMGNLTPPTQAYCASKVVKS